MRTDHDAVTARTHVEFTRLVPATKQRRNCKQVRRTQHTAVALWASVSVRRAALCAASVSSWGGTVRKARVGCRLANTAWLRATSFAWGLRRPATAGRLFSGALSEPQMLLTRARAAGQTLAPNLWHAHAGDFRLWQLSGARRIRLFFTAFEVEREVFSRGFVSRAVHSGLRDCLRGKISNP